MDLDPSPGGRVHWWHRRVSRRAFVVMSVVTVLCSATVGAVLAAVAPVTSTGVASEVVVDGTGSGVWRLAVRTGPHLPWSTPAPAALAVSSLDEALLTPDQRLGLLDAHTAACAELVQLGVLDTAAGERCADAAPPRVLTDAAASGRSAGLPTVLALLDARADLTGDLVVAATGTVEPIGFADGWVDPVAGERHKAAAAAAADADLVLVPRANERAFDASTAPGGPEVVAVSSVHEAVVELCARSRADGCVTWGLVAAD